MSLSRKVPNYISQEDIYLTMADRSKIRTYVRKTFFRAPSWGYPMRTHDQFDVDYHVQMCTHGMTVAFTAEHPNRTLTLTLTRLLTRKLWGDQFLDVVACEGSRLFRPTWMLFLEIL